MKHWLVQRIPKITFAMDDLSTLRDMSLLPTCYKVFSKGLCSRILLYIANQIKFWQQDFLSLRDHQELVFTLKAAFDDFRHRSTKIISIFVGFANALGSANHEYIFETLESFGIPLIYFCLMEDLDKLICGSNLTEIFYIISGVR